MKLNDYIQKHDIKLLFIAIVILLAISLVAPVNAACADVTTLAATGNTSHSVTLHMTVVIDQPVWFEYGLNSASAGEYPLVSPSIDSPVGAYGKVVDASYLMPGHTYYYRAACANCSGDEMNFIVTSVTPVPTTTFGDTTDDFVDAGWNLTALLPIVGGVYDNALVSLGAPAGFSYLLMWIFIFVAIWLRQENMMLAAMLFCILTATVVFSGFVPGVGMYIGYTVLVISGAAVLYYLLKGR